MIRIRKITEAHSDAGKAAVAEAQAILRAQFGALDEADIAKLPEQLGDPFTYRFVSELLIAEDARGKTKAFALVMHDPALRFTYLDFIATAPGATGGGVGDALYSRVRDDARARKSIGVFFECLPDDPALSPEPKIRRQNAARLKFYERYGARPITGTRYETPVSPDSTNPPYLVFDGLGTRGLPKARVLRQIVRAILERKYGDLCPPDYIALVLRSIRDGAFGLRAPRYLKDDIAPAAPAPAKAAAIPLVINDRHDIHHVRERGYVEAPVRIASILSELDKSGLFRRQPARHFGDRHIREVHDGGLVDYIERACQEAPLNRSVYPYVFPVRNPQRKPKDRSVLAGYWCIDTFTPLNRNAYPAARHAVDCALTAADLVLQGAPIAYALVRPPGHHAERRAFGGFCYFNNAAIAAQYLSAHGKVAVLDIDYHHGNGTQDIFYERDDVLTCSVHGHPRFAYPYFTGFRDERGRGRGAGFNFNLPLEETITPAIHRAAIDLALKRIARHAPRFLVLAVGFDTAQGDPTGTWPNRASDFEALGRMIGAAGFPLVVVQEGGYRVRTLGVNARHFFQGLAHGLAEAKPVAAPKAASPAPARARPQFRGAVGIADVEAIRRMVIATGKFSADEVAIAVELAEERIAKGRASGYSFVLADIAGKLAGYACYGPTPGTETTFDLYWIVVDPAHQGSGLGKALLTRVEGAVRAAGGRAVYVDTSSTPAYEATRAFYRNTGFAVLATLPDFYRPGDGKVILAKTLPPPEAAPGAGARSRSLAP
ncbi:MAG: GNAT family N-acetyltransferase [Alphaproteobacteria bacterium]|nr:GNAT family N-acetyltransferase [Alphaproteobacteria bacterium]